MAKPAAKMQDTAAPQPQAVAPAQPAATAVLPQKSERKISAARFKLADGVRNVWQVVPERDTPYEDVFKPIYWAHIATRLRPYDRIEVLAEDGSYFAELIVRSHSRISAVVQELRKTELGAAPQESAEEFAVEFGGPIQKYIVRRLKDRHIMHSGADTREAAMQWLSMNSRSLAA